jgi:hypothetical protein
MRILIDLIEEERILDCEKQVSGKTRKVAEVAERKPVKKVR